ncbi:Cyanovirin-N [Astrocystis sublimbata]|nr:Cyanovirin-N [Astrocystis sublimbata]
MHSLAIMAVISSGIATIAGAPSSPTSTINATASDHEPVNGTINSFADSCTSYGLSELSHDAWLGAYCRAYDGSQPYTSLNLNLCIANDFGKLAARKNGGFAQSCDRMLIHGARPILYAYCDNGKYAEETVIDLSDFIDNDNGRLHCFDQYAS